MWGLRHNAMVKLAMIATYLVYCKNVHHANGIEETTYRVNQIDQKIKYLLYIVLTYNRPRELKLDNNAVGHDSKHYHSCCT